MKDRYLFPPRAYHLCLACLAIVLAQLVSHAAPFTDLRIPFTQPDGTKIEVIGSGDEFYAEFETPDGFTVVYDPVLKGYCFANVRPDGQLASTGRLVHKANPSKMGLKKHVRMSRDARRQQTADRFRKWEAGMGVEAAWKAHKAESAETPKAATSSNGGPHLDPPSFTTTGNKVGLTLLIDFDDDPATVPQAEIFDFCNSDTYTNYGNNGSVKTYFRDVSNGLLTYSNVVTIYIRIPNSLHPKDWYNDTSKDCGAQANLLIRDALNILKALPNYQSEILPSFSNVTVDANNQVVACNVFYAGGNGSVWSKGLWPHSWSLYDVQAQELSPGGKKIYKYQITNIGSSLTIGTFCHENGHMLCGFPDIYDYDYDSKGGAGLFCLMNTGGSGGNPVQVCAYLKRAAGWATTTAIDGSSLTSGTLSALAGTNFNHFYVYRKPGVSTEYFLLEARHAGGRDARLPVSGVAIWHVDELGNHDNQNLLPNTSHQNYELTLVQADNRWDFEQNANPGDSNDLYYLGNNAADYRNDFSDGSSPGATWWDGTSSGAAFHGFSASGTVMTFAVGYSNLAPEILTQPQDKTVMAYRQVILAVGARGSAPMRYQWFLGESPIPGATSASYTIPSASPADEGDYWVTITNSLGGAQSTRAHLTVLPGLSLEDALDTTDVAWSTGGDSGWEAQVETSHDGTDAAQSAALLDMQESWLQTTLNNGPGTLYFWWKVSSETNYDFLEFYLDGVLQNGRISGETGWTQKTIAVPSGTHVARWVYAKDEGVKAGFDKAWVDQVIFVAEGPSAPKILSQPSSQMVMKGSPVSMSVLASGSAPLSYQWSFNGNAIPEATGSIYLISEARSDLAGDYQVLVTNQLGSAASSVATLTVVDGLTLGQVLDAPSFTWSTGGSLGWVPQMTTSRDGQGSAQSGGITHSQESWLETTISSGPGNLNFWWRVSSETNWDFLEFYVDGAKKTRISGSPGWQQLTYAIPSGTHTIRWRYVKDQSASNGSDCGWVDEVSFIPTTLTPPTITSFTNAAGHMQLEITGSAGAPCVVLGSTNLADWVPLQTNTPPFTFRDPQPASAPRQFYRARSGN